MFRNLIPSFVTNLKSRAKLPEKFKGTIVEKWADYWRNLLIDYKQMLIDLRFDIQENPKKAFYWTSGLTTSYLLATNNPDEFQFKDNLKRIENEVVMVSEDCLNPKSITHVRFLETCYNEGVLHYKNFGIASVMYTTDLNDECNLYKTQCKYLQPSLFTFPSRIVDVGIMGRWWNIYIKTTNYDVN